MMGARKVWRGKAVRERRDAGSKRGRRGAAVFVQYKGIFQWMLSHALQIMLRPRRVLVELQAHAAKESSAERALRHNHDVLASHDRERW